MTASPPPPPLAADEETHLALQKDLHLALQRLQLAEKQLVKLGDSNVALAEENEDMSNEMQDALQDINELRKENAMFQFHLAQLKKSTNITREERDAAQERLQEIDLIKRETSLGSNRGGLHYLAPAEVEEKIQMARIEERSRITLMFGEQKRTKETMEVLQRQKEELEQELDRLQAIMFQRETQGARPGSLHTNNISSSFKQTFAAKNVAWLNTAVDFFFVPASPVERHQKSCHMRRSSCVESSRTLLIPGPSYRSVGSSYDDSSVPSQMGGVSSSASSVEIIISPSPRRRSSVDEYALNPGTRVQGSLCDSVTEQQEESENVLEQILMEDHSEDERLVSAPQSDKKHIRSQHRENALALMSKEHFTTQQCLSYQCVRLSDDYECGNGEKRRVSQNKRTQKISQDEMALCARMSKSANNQLTHRRDINSSSSNIKAKPGDFLSISDHGALLKHRTLKEKGKGLSFSQSKDMSKTLRETAKKNLKGPRKKTWSTPVA
jgi:hypothetical protein